VAASALEKGANSFTEGQAKSRLEGAGLMNVTDLKKDDDGVWRGKAMRNGKSVTVGFDYKGNIAAE
jgi:putative membrane protein